MDEPTGWTRAKRTYDIHPVEVVPRLAGRPSRCKHSAARHRSVALVKLVRTGKCENGQAAPTPTLDRGNDGSDTRRVPERRIATANPSMASTVQQGKIGRKDQTNAFECAKTAWRREEEQHMTRRKQKTGSADKDNRAEVLAVGRLSAPAAAAASRAWRAAHAGKRESAVAGQIARKGAGCADSHIGPRKRWVRYAASALEEDCDRESNYGIDRPGIGNRTQGSDESNR